MNRQLANGVTLGVTEFPRREFKGRARPETPTIVMIHGLAASQAFWYAAGAPVMTLLGNVLLYDLRGHGKSDMPPSGYGVGTMAEDLVAMLDARGIERAHIVAHSFGGMIALVHALRHPGRVASLTLVDARVRPIQRRLSIPIQKLPLAAERRLAALGIDLEAVSSLDDGIGYLSTVARIELEAGDDAAELLHQLYRHPKIFRSRRNAERWIALTERVSLVADLRNESVFDRVDLQRLSAPMLILVAGLSNVMPSARELARLCPHAILREVPGVGHFFPMSQPALFLRPTLRFLHAVNRGLRPAS
jgi:pimeloyl-ACP methyl ester carboxylesterase